MGKITTTINDGLHDLLNKYDIKYNHAIEVGAMIMTSELNIETEELEKKRQELYNRIKDIDQKIIYLIKEKIKKLNEVVQQKKIEIKNQQVKHPIETVNERRMSERINMNKHLTIKFNEEKEIKEKIDELLNKSVEDLRNQLYRSEIYKIVDLCRKKGIIVGYVQITNYLIDNLE